MTIGMGGVSTPGTFLEAMATVADIADEGFTFVNEGRQERFVPYRELMVAVHRQAGALQASGFAPGERVALIIPEQQAFVVSFLAALAARLVPVPIYPPYSLAKAENWRQATEGILRVAGPAAIVAVDDVCPLLWSVASRLNAKVLTPRQLDAHPPVAFTPAEAEPDDIAFLQFTSGSTRAPRGVIVSHRNLVENCTRIVSAFVGQAEVRGVSWLPLYHDMGLIGCVLTPLLARRSVVLLDTMAFLKRPSLWFDLIHRHRATITFAPPFALALAVRRIGADDVARWDLSCLRVLGCGAEPVSADVLRTFARHFAPAGVRSEVLCPCYGLAEATLLATYAAVDDHWHSDIVDAERLFRHGAAEPPTAGASTLEFVSCGTTIADHVVRVVDESGRPSGERRVGEIEVRGPSVTGGYFADPDATSLTYVDGWLRTGDLGYVAGRQLFITGRKRDLIIVHGRNYAPENIEWTINGVPSVRAGNVVAFAHPGHDGLDRIAVACEAVTTDPAEVGQAVRARVRDELALTVGEVVVLPPGALPKTSSGKVQRARTRALFADGTLLKAAQAGGPTVSSRRLLMMRLRWHAVVGSIRYRVHRLRPRRRATDGRAR